MTATDPRSAPYSSPRPPSRGPALTRATAAAGGEQAQPLKLPPGPRLGPGSGSGATVGGVRCEVTGPRCVNPVGPALAAMLAARLAPAAGAASAGLCGQGSRMTEHDKRSWLMVSEPFPYDETGVMNCVGVTGFAVRCQDWAGGGGDWRASFYR